MKLRVSAIGLQPCEACKRHATLRTLDVAVAAQPARKGYPAVPAGWCPLIALCGMCWRDVRNMLRAKAIPDSSG